MSENQRCPEGCGRPVEFSIHEGTGQRIIWNPGQQVVHKCNKLKVYWCIYCADGQGMAIPKERPCVHRQPIEIRRINKNSLDDY